MSYLKSGDVIVFAGDSITDCERDREVREGNSLDGLGRGFVSLLASRLRAERWDDALTFYNRGCSGDRVVGLAARWERDVLVLEPDVISVLVGVNDTWHAHTADAGVGVAEYERVYRGMLERTREVLGGVRLVLCDPFCLRCGVVDDAWVDEMEERQEVVWRLARDFEALHLPYGDVFESAMETAGVEPSELVEDGVHPTPSGHALMAAAWCQVVG